MARITTHTITWTRRSEYRSWTGTLIYQGQMEISLFGLRQVHEFILPLVTSSKIEVAEQFSNHAGPDTVRRQGLRSARGHFRVTSVTLMSSTRFTLSLFRFLTRSIAYTNPSVRSHIIHKAQKLHDFQKYHHLDSPSTSGNIQTSQPQPKSNRLYQIVGFCLSYVYGSQGGSVIWSSQILTPAVILIVQKVRENILSH
jgi:hypothetical protein